MSAYRQRQEQPESPSAYKRQPSQREAEALFSLPQNLRTNAYGRLHILRTRHINKKKKKFRDSRSMRLVPSSCVLKQVKRKNSNV
ncbi:unnamed protein product [Allacma fusca]|uniref:Uncharacterized protein n=1 Tax=Allacma fusca TaxID=39272 RepID=A0A8J2JXM8_9HEXA|nr:unnamed protein product [Allacma fusca]